jgi:hypothetical protein
MDTAALCGVRGLAETDSLPRIRTQVPALCLIGFGFVSMHQVLDVTFRLRTPGLGVSVFVLQEISVGRYTGGAMTHGP